MRRLSLVFVLCVFLLLVLPLISVDNNSGSDAEILSWNPRIFLHRSFLSHDECDMLIDMAKKSSMYNPSITGDISVYLPAYPNLPEEVKRIERRIGAVTGVPPHPYEESINIHHNRVARPSVSTSVDVKECLLSGGDAESCHLAVHGVHHDKVQKEYSTVTLIAYMNDIEIGGGTVWPCTAKLNATDIDKDPSLDITKACSDAFSSSARWFDGSSVVDLSRKKHKIRDAKAKQHLQRILEGAHLGCIDPVGRQSSVISPAVRSTAKKGDAIVFFHDHLDLSPDVMTWHAGCLQGQGEEKWTLQKFKELPRNFRSTDSSNLHHNEL